MDKLILTAAVTGSIPTRKDSPYIPVTPEEVAEDVYKCCEAGVSIVHLHARDRKTGLATADAGVFKDYMKAIREKCDVIINLTTGGGRIGNRKPEDIMKERIALKPEMMSLNMGSINAWAEGIQDMVFMNTTKFIEFLAKTMLEYGVKPELEIYHSGMLNTAVMLKEKGLLEEPIHFQFVLVGGTGASPTVKDLLFMVESMPENSTWSACGLGRYEVSVATAAVMLGGHARIGMEDNLYYSKGVLAKSNAELVARVARIAKELGREIATVDEARAMLGMRR
jgi:3-keto-5-aminohexanoate cleavage enzyme